MTFLWHHLGNQQRLFEIFSPSAWFSDPCGAVQPPSPSLRARNSSRIADSSSSPSSTSLTHHIHTNTHMEYSLSLAPGLREPTFAIHQPALPFYLKRRTKLSSALSFFFCTLVFFALKIDKLLYFNYSIDFFPQVYQMSSKRSDLRTKYAT